MQLINCIEAIKYFNCDDNWLVITLFSSARVKRIKVLLEKYHLRDNFSHVFNMRIIDSTTQMADWFNVLVSRLVIEYFVLFRKFSCVIVGHYLNWPERFILYKVPLKNPDCRCVLVDDGAGTIRFAQARQNEQLQGRMISLSSKKLRFLFSIDMKRIYPKKLTYFTNYPVAEYLLSEDDMVKNDYSNILNLLASDVRNYYSRMEETLVILGQPLSFVDVLTDEKYLFYLHEAIRIIEERRHINQVLYFPHPDEQNIGLVTSCFPNFKIVKSDIPFEMVAMSLPSTCSILGFYTSALWNCNLLPIQPKIYSILIRESDYYCNESKKKAIMSVYDDFINSFIEAIRV